MGGLWVGVGVGLGFGGGCGLWAVGGCRLWAVDGRGFGQWGWILDGGCGWNVGCRWAWVWATRVDRGLWAWVRLDCGRGFWACVCLVGSGTVPDSGRARVGYCVAATKATAVSDGGDAAGRGSGAVSMLAALWRPGKNMPMH